MTIFADSDDIESLLLSLSKPPDRGRGKGTSVKQTICTYLQLHWSESVKEERGEQNFASVYAHVESHFSM